MSNSNKNVTRLKGVCNKDIVQVSKSEIVKDVTNAFRAKSFAINRNRRSNIIIKASKLAILFTASNCFMVVILFLKL